MHRLPVLDRASNRSEKKNFWGGAKLHKHLRSANTAMGFRTRGPLKATT